MKSQEFREEISRNLRRKPQEFKEKIPGIQGQNPGMKPQGTQVRNPRNSGNSSRKSQGFWGGNPGRLGDKIPRNLGMKPHEFRDETPGIQELNPRSVTWCTRSPPLGRTRPPRPAGHRLTPNPSPGCAVAETRKKNNIKTQFLLHKSQENPILPGFTISCSSKGFYICFPKGIWGVSKDLSELRIFFFSLKFLINQELIKNCNQILQRGKI